MKIICIGCNYVKHIEELKHQVPSEPVIFMKPDSAIVKRNQDVYLPDFSNELHHEVELVVKINRLGKNIAPRFAHRYYEEIGIGIDFTARDIQRKCLENGLPWEISKAFDRSAPIGKFLPKSELGDLRNLDFHLDVNGITVQKGNSSNMIFPVDEIISYVSRFFTLKIGDLIFTGTPEGVGPVNMGDRLEAFIGDKKLLDFRVK